MGDRSGFVFNVNSIHLYSNNFSFQIKLILLKMKFFSFQIVVAAVVFSLYTDATEIGRITDWNNNPLSHGKRMDQEKRVEGQKTLDIQQFCNTVCGKDCEVTYNSNEGEWCHDCDGGDDNEVSSCTNRPMDGTCGHDDNGDNCCYVNGSTQCA